MNLAATLSFTALLSFMPISELRGAIPFAILHGIPWYWAYLYCVVLNALVAPVCWIFLVTLHILLYGINEEEGFRWYKNLFNRFVEKTRNKLSGKIEKWGWLGIAIFVAIPLPVTGAWTGTIGAWILGISKKRTMAAVILGVAIAGAIVTAIVVFGKGAFNFFIKKIDIA